MEILWDQGSAFRRGSRKFGDRVHWGSGGEAPGKFFGPRPFPFGPRPFPFGPRPFS